MTKQTKSLPPSMAWLTVFVPALAYYIATRMNVARFLGHSSLGVVQTQTIQVLGSTSTTTAGRSPSSSTTACSLLQDIFYVSDCINDGNAKLNRPLYLILQDGLQDVVATTWRHDSELGRGYLLLSQAHKGGRIWRYEVGGGPIPIGKTLHMEPSGCRSNKWLNCEKERVGSAGLAVDFYQQEHSREGLLVVAELGEGRIVRMEESGTRTPLIINVPSLCSSTTTKTRLTNPSVLLYTPFGDLLVAEQQSCGSGGILRLRNSMQIPPLDEKAATSRQAHSWNETLNHDKNVEILYSSGSERIGGIALDKSWTGIFVTSIQENNMLLLHIPLGDDDEDNGDSDDEDEDDNDDAEEKEKDGADKTVLDSSGLLDTKAQLVYNITLASSHGIVEGGSLAIDQKGQIFIAVANGVLVLTERGNPIGKIDVPKTPTSLTLADDGFLYAATQNQLYRIQVKSAPLQVPTNLVGKVPSNIF